MTLSKQRLRALPSERDVLISALAQITELIVETSKYDARLPGLKAEQKRLADRLNASLVGDDVE